MIIDARSRRMAALVAAPLAGAWRAEPRVMQSVAGTGAKGYQGDGGAAAAALLDQPFQCAFAPSCAENSSCSTSSVRK